MAAPAPALDLRLELKPPRIIATGKRIAVDSFDVRERDSYGPGEDGIIIEYEADGATHSLELVVARKVPECVTLPTRGIHRPEQATCEACYQTLPVAKVIDCDDHGRAYCTACGSVPLPCCRGGSSMIQPATTPLDYRADDPEPCADCTRTEACREHDGVTTACDRCSDIYPDAATVECASHASHYCAPCALESDQCCVCELPVMPCCVSELAGCSVHVACREDADARDEDAAICRWENRRDREEYHA